MRAWLALFIVTLLHLSPAQAQSPDDAARLAAAPVQAEYINAFAADIDVQRDGDLLVTERIEVNAAMEQIRHGIVRDFPTLYRAGGGLRVQVGFDVLAVLRDGAHEPYRLESLPNGVRIRIGDAGRFIAPGRHQYEIRYRTTRQLGFFRDFDELYWNVTGNGWTFPIAQASARIHLPQATGILRTSLYTGRQGARERNAQETARGGDFVAFQTTAPLDVQEGLTVAVAWPKGVVQPPSPALTLYYHLRDNLAAATAILGACLLSACYLAAWRRTRRRTPAHIVPLFEPPQGMSAPAVRYMVRMGSDDRAFVVGVIELIALRAMRIRNTLGETRFRRLEPTVQDERGLQRDPLLGTMLDKMFGPHKSFKHSQAGMKRLRDARASLHSALDAKYSGYMESNARHAWRGVWLWLLYLAACIATLVLQEGNFGATLGSLPFMLIGMAALPAVFSVVRTPGQGCALVFCLLFCIPFLGSGIAVLVSENLHTPLRALSSLLPALLFPVAIGAFRYLRRYTAEGYEIMDRIAGFRQYLTLAEGPRLEALTTVEEKLRLYERYLPYAVALDVGRKWAAVFAGLAATVAGAQAARIIQDMYGGQDILASDPMPAVYRIGHQATPTATPSSSGSPGTSDSWSGMSDSSSGGGSSDSGSSGDGGGGGGGSGW